MSDRNRKGENEYAAVFSNDNVPKHTNTYMTYETFTGLFQLFP